MSPPQSDATGSDVRDRPDDASADAIEPMPGRKQTLPPPEWDAPRSVSGLALEWLAFDAPVARRTGARAEAASLRAQLDGGATDAEGERLAAASLARWLAARGTELHRATKLARRSLMLGEDPSLREELAAWFAGLGEPARAAATLRPLLDLESGERLARVLTRVAVFLGRAGDAAGAADALARAAEVAPGDPVPHELRAAIGVWAPEAVPAAQAAEAYVRAARCRELGGDAGGALEDLLRAFEVSPSIPIAAESLAESVAARGRRAAADEVLRAHAAALGPDGRAVHLRRLRSAVADGDLLRAVGAAFDAGLPAEVDVDAAVSAVEELDAAPLAQLDALLLRVGLPGLVAARLEYARALARDGERARLCCALGRLYAEHLGDARAAADAWLEALTVDPDSDRARVALREHAAATGDHGPLVEALLCAGLTTTPGPVRHRLDALRELLTLAEQRLSDPSLALWAARRALACAAGDQELEEVARRLAPLARLQDEALAVTRADLQKATGPARVEQLRVAAAALKGRPADAAELIAVLTELVARSPDDDWAVALERLLRRENRADALERLWTEQLGGSRATEERARLSLAASRIRAGAPHDALGVLEPLLARKEAHRRAYCWLAVLGAQLGRRRVQARALRRLAALCEAPQRSLLSSVAAELLVDAGEWQEAGEAAEQACRADPSQARPVVALARAVRGRHDRVAAVALERAMGVAVPRAALCRALADTCDAIGEPERALAWTQRWLALRPGDPDAAGTLLRRATAMGDAPRLADALAWLLSQPQPLAGLSPLLSAASCRLAELEPARGSAVARRALDVFGARVQSICEAVEAIADRASERGLSIALIERRLAAGMDEADRPRLLLDLARLRRSAGDADGAARTLVRALRGGASAAAVLAELEVALPPRTPDGELSLMEARAEALGVLPDVDPEAAARAFREHGAGLWDLAGDVEGAVRAWERAATLDPERGVARMARDLLAFAGHREAMRRLVDFAGRFREGDEASVLVAAAAVALDAGDGKEALAIASRALEKNPSRADVIALVERAAGDDDIDELERAYEIVIAATRGCYGERAAHYRAARQLERRGQPERALRHAIRAFESVPAEGVTFVLMMRLGERTGSLEDVISAIDHVAEGVVGPEERARWLRRAALVSGADEEGKRQRVEMLLRALDANPEPETLRSLSSAVADLVREVPEEQEIAQMRLERAVARMLAKLDGAEGARTAVQVAAATVEGPAEPSVALAALSRAVELDAGIDELAEAEAYAPRLAGDPAAASAFVSWCIERLGTSPDASADAPRRALVTLAEALALALADPLLHARLLVCAARREPDALDLLRRAEDAVARAGDTALSAELRNIVPPEQRARRLVDAADTAEAEGEGRRAIEHLEAALAAEALEAEERRRVVARLARLYEGSGLIDELEALLRAELGREEAEPEQLRAALELSRWLSGRGREAEALEVIGDALSRAPANRELLERAVALTRAVGDRRREAEALSRLVEVETASDRRLATLRTLAALLEEMGDAAGAAARHEQIVALDPDDAAALAALERHAERRGDWEAAATLLRRLAERQTTRDGAKQLRLRRAEILDVRLGRPMAARSELEGWLEQAGDDPEVLEVLARLDERLGARLRAASLLRRAMALGPDRDRAARLGTRACRAFLDGGDIESARGVLEELAAHPPTPELLSLRAEVERRGDGSAALAVALDASSDRITTPGGVAVTELRPIAPASSWPPSSAPPASPRSPRRGSSSMPPAFPPASESEAALLAALDQGAVEAGKALMRQLENRADRTHDLVNVARRVSVLLPGDRWVLERLHAAALADRNAAYAGAVEHVLRAFGPGRTPAPPLGDQLEQADRVQAMLFRDVKGPANEALALVWSGAEHLFRRDPTSYGVTGLERVAPSAPTPLARAYEAASRLLGSRRVPLFQRRSAQAVTIQVALLSPPALIVSGEISEESPALAYHLGAMLAATRPEYVLVYGSPEEQARSVLKALHAAFGPPRSTPTTGLASIATLAEMLWESIPARAQRRLRELCDDADALDYDAAVEAARQAARRAGLFVSADVSMAVSETCAELGVATTGLEGTDGLSALCSECPAVADLVRLATSPEYADARWQQTRMGGRPPSGTWSTFRAP